MALDETSWPTADRRTRLVPPRAQRVLSEFWSTHPRLVRPIAVAALAWGTGYLAWRWASTGAGVPVLLFWPLLGAETFGVIAFAAYTWLTWHEPSAPLAPPPTTNPRDVDVFVTTCDEPVEVVEPTLAGCAAIRGPHTTYLLDDGGRDEMRELAARYGAGYVARSDRCYAKAGSISHALTVTNGELILVLDAGHVPMPEILEATLGYFDEPTVALVQTAHEFSDRDVAPHHDSRRHEHALFYDVIAPNKDRHNAMFWCGSAALIRRLALRDAGGVRTKTAAETFHTTIAMHAAGWRTRYHRQVLVQGHASHDLAGFLRQQARWARGSLGVLRTRENPLWCPGLTLPQRLSYLGSLLPSFRGIQRFTFLAVLALVFGSGRLPMHASLRTLAAFWVPWSILASAATIALARGTLAPLDSTRVSLLTMGVQLRALPTLVRPKAATVEVTREEGTNEGVAAALQMLPALTTGLIMLATAVLVRYGAVIGLVHLPSLSAAAFAVVLVLTAWVSWCIVMMLRSLGQPREVHHRYRLPVQAMARVQGRSIKLTVLGMSTSGLSLLAPLVIDTDTRLQVLTRLPDARGKVRDVNLPVIVHSCRGVVLNGKTGPITTFHLDATFDDLRGVDRRTVLEYCAVPQSARAAEVPSSGPEPAEVEGRVESRLAQVLSSPS